MSDVTAAAETPDLTPISLYLDLEEGQIADIEVVARTALAWSSAIKEITYIFDPSVEIRVELASGTEGSLSLNSLIRKIRGTPGVQSDLRMIALAVVTWFMMQGASYTFAAVMDYLRGKDAPSEARQMTDAQLEELASRIAEKMGARVARPQRQEIYRELERDSAVRGVGVSLKPNTRPSYIVLRKDFAAASGSVIQEPIAAKRKTSSKMNVTLISPTLKGVPRSWRFQYGTLPEFGATMKDTAFLQAIEEGRISIPLRTGVEMEVEIESKEENEGGLWVVKERAVSHVYRPRISSSGELPLEGPAES